LKKRFAEEEKRAKERVSKKTDRLPDEMIFLLVRALLDLKQREKKKNMRVYISSAKNEKRINNAPHK
jgi:hypothetical protein